MDNDRLDTVIFEQQLDIYLRSSIGSSSAGNAIEIMRIFGSFKKWCGVFDDTRSNHNLKKIALSEMIKIASAMVDLRRGKRSLMSRIISKF